MTATGRDVIVIDPHGLRRLAAGLRARAEAYLDARQRVCFEECQLSGPVAGAADSTLDDVRSELYRLAQDFGTTASDLIRRADEAETAPCCWWSVGAAGTATGVLLGGTLTKLLAPNAPAPGLGTATSSAWGPGVTTAISAAWGGGVTLSNGTATSAAYGAGATATIGGGFDDSFVPSSGGGATATIGGGWNPVTGGGSGGGATATIGGGFNPVTGGGSGGGATATIGGGFSDSFVPISSGGGGTATIGNGGFTLPNDPTEGAGRYLSELILLGMATSGTYYGSSMEDLARRDWVNDPNTHFRDYYTNDFDFQNQPNRPPENLIF